MRFAKMRTSLALALFMLSLSGLYGFAQSVTSGDLTGTVTDSSGAVIPQATVTLRSTSEGTSQTTATNQSGNYHFSLLKPGNYLVSASAPNMAETRRTVDVQLGQISNVMLSLGARGQNQTIEVTAEAPQLQTENPNLTTTIDQRQIALQPNPGNDTTYYAQTTPGVVMNVGGNVGGYGNFAAFGLPPTSNLFTINGNDNNDPFLNLNNSGSSNLTLGANEMQEVAVVTNGYTAQYGRMAGVQMDSVTKSGGNQFHGNANYYWNGTALNANDWFNPSTNTPRPFAVNNEWSASFGGAIIKNKTFFFVDTEGLRYILPSTQNIFLPTTEFETAVLNNLTANAHGAEVPFYNQMFSLYNNAPGHGNYSPVSAAVDPTQGCHDLTTLPGFGAGGAPCALFDHASGTNLNKEWLLAGRIDENISNNDKLFGRVHFDRGSQPTGTDLIDPKDFNTLSIQPTSDGQLNETHVFSANVVNELVLSGMWYSAVFKESTPVSDRLSVLPYNSVTLNGALSTLGGTQTADTSFPQGRNVTQYQILDDISINHGNHTFKLGLNFRRNDVSDYGNEFNAFGTLTFGNLTDFANGLLTPAAGNTYAQNFTNFPVNPIAIYSVGIYFQDEWKINSNLKLTAAIRADRNSNAVCQTDCFSRLAEPFTSLNHDPTIPYNEAIQANQHRAFGELQKVAFQPRVGISWSPFGARNTVIRTGIGMFTDLYQGVIVTNLEANAPTLNALGLTGSSLTGNPSAPGIPVAPGVSINGINNVQTTAVNSNTAFNSGFSSGATLAQLQAAVPGFAPPLFFSTGKISNPTYVKWNLEIQQALGSKTSVDLNYIGTHGYDELIENDAANAYSPNGALPIPITAPDARFGPVTQLYSGGVSNYAGLVASVTRRAAYGFSGSASYTWSHSLDETTGLFNTPVAIFNTVPYQLDPNNLRLNYGNSDLDIRHNFTANFVWEEPFRFQNHLLNEAAGGWSLSGTLFARTGLPYSVIDSSAPIANIPPGSFGLPSQWGVYATLLNPNQSFPSCSSPGNVRAGDAHQCLTTSMFVPAGAETSFGSGRNLFRGPGYFDMDAGLMKNFSIGERVKFTMGANFFNLLNHPHFATPENNLVGGIGQFGQLYATAPTPTSIYGAFQSAGVTGRLVQLVGKITF
jgi:Carboxypeptidase regulatory-like domain/TonB-dependent Receptor Plug Domain/TonB dependent receptor